ncbi:MAG: DUF4129 domain-containing protein [Bacillota bacterium]
MQLAGDTPLNNRILTALMRASIDLCWLIPAAHVLGFSLPGDRAIVDGASAAIALYVPAAIAALLWHVASASPRRAATGVFCFSLLWTATIWWLHNRDALEAGIFRLFTPEYFPYAVISLIYLGVLVYRALAASIRPDAHMITANAVRGCGLTAVMLLVLKYSAGWYPVWPVLLLPLALVGSSVAARAALITPTPSESRLGWRGRWAIITLLVAVPLAATLLLVSLSAPGFWAAVGSALSRAWSLAAEIIVFAVYPFAYLAYLAYNLLARFIPQDGEMPEVEVAEPPDLGELGPAAESPLGAAILIALRIVGALIVAAALIWAFRRLRHPGPPEDDAEYSEERISLWDPGALGRRLRQLVSPGPGSSTTRTPARTATEQRVRQLYRELILTVRGFCPPSPFQTPRDFCGRLIERAGFSTAEPVRSIHRLLETYEAVRYGPPREDEHLRRSAEEAMENLRQQNWRRVSRGNR